MHYFFDHQVPCPERYACCKNGSPHTLCDNNTCDPWDKKYKDHDIIQELTQSFHNILSIVKWWRVEGFEPPLSNIGIEPISRPSTLSSRLTPHFHNYFLIVNFRQSFGDCPDIFNNLAALPKFNIACWQVSPTAPSLLRFSIILSVSRGTVFIIVSLFLSPIVFNI